jgi:hypothetical protein
MREFAWIFICWVGLIVIGLWAMALILVIRSGKGILSLFSRQVKHQWLSIPETIALYPEDHSLPAD